MTMLMGIGNPSSEPPVGFNTPLAMFAECHRRIEKQLRTMERLTLHLKEHGSDKAAAQAAQSVLRYFELAAPKHHADEERDLFPALLESMAGSDAVCLRQLIDGLETEHVELERKWHALRAVLQSVAAGQPAILNAEDVRDFETVYARHIAREEGEVLPMAERLLSDEAKAAIGEAMRARRAG